MQNYALLWVAELLIYITYHTHIHIHSQRLTKNLFHLVTGTSILTLFKILQIAIIVMDSRH